MIFIVYLVHTNILCYTSRMEAIIFMPEHSPLKSVFSTKNTWGYKSEHVHVNTSISLQNVKAFQEMAANYVQDSKSIAEGQPPANNPFTFSLSDNADSTES